MTSLWTIAGTMTALGAGLGWATGHLGFTFVIVLTGWFPLLFIGMLGLGLKADEFFGVKHGYGWEPVLRED